MKKSAVQLFVPSDWPGQEWSKTLDSDSIIWHISAYDRAEAAKNSYSEVFFKNLAEKSKQGNVFIALVRLEEKDTFDETVLRGWLDPEITSGALIIAAPDKQRARLPSGEQIIPLTTGIQPHDLKIVVEKSAALVANFRSLEKSKVSEIEWLTRIEQIFKLTNTEIRNAEASAYAYQQLAEYEQHLLSEQRRVTAALVNLQEYRDQVKGDWLQEKAARENIQGLMTSEIKNMSEVMRAQEQLLKYAEEEKKMFRALMAEFQKNGSLNKEDLRRLLTGHDMLLKELDRLQSK